MLLLLGEYNCIRGITYKVLSNIKLKWLHSPCTSPSEPLFSPSLLLSPFHCKVHIEVWKESHGNWHMLDLISLECSCGPTEERDCHFYTIYSSPGLIACFLSEEIFPVKVLYLSFISPFFFFFFALSLRGRVLICIYPKGKPFTHFRSPLRVRLLWAFSGP